MVVVHGGWLCFHRFDDSRRRRGIGKQSKITTKKSTAFGNGGTSVEGYKL